MNFSKPPLEKNYYEQIWQKAKMDNSSLIASSSIKESYKVAHSIVVQALQKNRNLITSAFRLSTGDIIPVYYVIYNSAESMESSQLSSTVFFDYYKKAKKEILFLSMERISMSEFISNYIVEKLL